MLRSSSDGFAFRPIRLSCRKSSFIGFEPARIPNRSIQPGF